MIIFLIIGIVLVGAAIGVVARALSPGRQKQAEGLTHIERYGFRGRSEGTNETGGRMLDRLDSVASRLGTAVGAKSAAFDLAGIPAQPAAARMSNTTPRKLLPPPLPSPIRPPPLPLPLPLPAPV